MCRRPVRLVCKRGGTWRYIGYNTTMPDNRSLLYAAPTCRANAMDVVYKEIVESSMRLIVSGDDKQTQSMVDAGCVRAVLPLLGHALAYKANPTGFLMRARDAVGPTFSIDLAGLVTTIVSDPATMRKVANEPESMLSARAAVSDPGQITKILAQFVCISSTRVEGWRSYFVDSSLRQSDGGRFRRRALRSAAR